MSDLQDLLSKMEPMTKMIIPDPVQSFDLDDHIHEVLSAIEPVAEVLKVLVTVPKFTCKDCGVYYNYPSQLQRHKQKHTN